MKLGILGGTFDPIHYGHLLMAERAAEAYGLDRVLLMPTGNPPHKDGGSITPAAHRLAMTKLAAADNPLLEVSDYEVNKREKCYTAKTLQYLSEITGASLYYIFGADSLRDFSSWYMPEEIARLATLLVAGRYPDEDAAALAKEYESRYGARVHLMPFPRMEISSTDLRERIGKGLSCRYQIPEKVLAYIRENQLYRA